MSPGKKSFGVGTLMAVPLLNVQECIKLHSGELYLSIFLLYYINRKKSICFHLRAYYCYTKGDYGYTKRTARRALT